MELQERREKKIKRKRKADKKCQPPPPPKKMKVNKWFLLTLSLKPFKSQVKGKHSSREVAVQGPDKNLRVLGQKKIEMPWRMTQKRISNKTSLAKYDLRKSEWCCGPLGFIRIKSGPVMVMMKLNQFSQLRWRSIKVIPKKPLSWHILKNSKEVMNQQS